MNRVDLEFLLAFANIEGLMNKPVTEVIVAVDYLNSTEYMRDYLYHYRLMKEYHLDSEIKTLVRYGGYNFFMACEDWDI